jgi:hypothetical protein
LRNHGLLIFVSEKKFLDTNNQEFNQALNIVKEYANEKI